MNMKSDIFFNNVLTNVLTKCKEKQIFLCMIGCIEIFVITFKPYVDFCQTQDLLGIQEIEQQYTLE